MFANIKAKLLKVDLRKGGKKVLVFESSVRMSAGELDAIAEMIDQDVNLGLDAQVISYRVQRNARTNEPVVSYKVDDKGAVSEVKFEGEQAEMDLGLPPEKPQIVEEQAEISRAIVNEFILSGLAPSFEEIEYDIVKILKRNEEGESYLRIAADLELSSGRLAEILEEYSRRVAPLAAKWHEWRESKAKAVDAVIEQSIATAAEAEKPAGEQAPSDPDAESADDQQKSVKDGEQDKGDSDPDDLPGLD